MSFKVRREVWPRGLQRWRQVRRPLPLRATQPARTATLANRSSTSMRERKIDRRLEREQHLRIQRASNRPAAPPTNESRILSVRSCRIRRRRFAPIARRIAISRRRSVARASMSPARLVHVTSSTRPTAAIITHVKLTTAPRRSGIMKPGGPTLIACPSLLSGYSLASCWPNRLSEASACRELTPGFRRPTAKKFLALRSSSQVAPGSAHSIIAAGTQISGE